MMLMLALVGALLVAETTQQSGKDPTQDVCRRYKHLTCVADSKLFLYGGLAYYGSVMNDSTLETSKLHLRIMSTLSRSNRHVPSMGGPIQSRRDQV